MRVSELARMPARVCVPVRARHIHVLTPPTTHVPPLLDLADAVANAAAVAPATPGSVPEVQPLGAPPTLLLVLVPPSTPVYMRRGLLLAVYGLHDDARVHTTTPTRLTRGVELLTPLKRLAYGNLLLVYEKVSASTALLVLVSASTRSWFRSGSKLFATLVLDGRVDWAVLPRDALQVYTGDSTLVIRTLRAPSGSRTKWYRRLATGLGWWKGYTLVLGRGYVGLAGNGQVYRVELRNGEELTIAKKAIVAVSVDGPYGLGPALEQQVLAEPPAAAVVESAEPLPLTAWEKAWHQAKAVARWTYAKARGTTAYTASLLSGSHDYVTVKGPRAVLLQLLQSESQRGYSSFTVGQVKNEREVEPLEPSPRDFLSNVLIVDGKAVFKSVDSFVEPKPKA